MHYVNVATSAFKPSHIKAEMHHVAVLDDVIGAFEPHLAGILGALLAAAGDKIGVGDGFGPDKASLEIGVDDRGGLWRLGAAGHGPGARLLGAGGEIGDPAPTPITRPPHPLPPR